MPYSRASYVIRVANSGILIPGAAFSSFNVPRAARKSHEVKAQAGDSMSVNVCGFFWLYVLAYNRHFGA